MAQGIIEATKPSQSGKTLGVLIGGKWYSTKAPELANMVGQMITFETSRQYFPQGGSCHWLNDYTVVGQAGNAADAAFQQAHAQNQGQTAPQNVSQAAQGPFQDRNASIVAQALTKACTVPGDAVEVVWGRFRRFYGLASGQSDSAVNSSPPTDFPYDDSPPY